MTEIRRADFTLILPSGRWDDHSTPDVHDFRRSNDERVLVAFHFPRTPLAQPHLLDAVSSLCRSRLTGLQIRLHHSFRFDAPVVRQEKDKAEMTVFGKDMRHIVLVKIRFFGRPHSIAIVSYYDYSGALSLEEFNRRADSILASVEID
jgi:hypothetical protein